MSILEKAARIIFFPIYWMRDIRRELTLMRRLMAIRMFLDLRHVDPRDITGENWGQSLYNPFAGWERESFWKEFFLK
jgi:hypothetical protein